MTDWSHSEYVTAALENMRRTSRTAHGVGDTSSSSNKPRLREEGIALQQRAEANYVTAAETVLRKRFDVFRAPPEIRELVLNTASTVSAGLLDTGQSLWRTWTTKYPRQLAPDRIPDAFNEFSARLWQELNGGGTPTIRLAGWIEYQIDGIIHPFADGCSRTAKATSLLVLARANIPLPLYPQRDDYYAALAQEEDAWLSFYSALFTK